jgi:hypothetical protein
VGIIAAVVVLAGVATLLYFTVFSGDDDYCSVLEDNEIVTRNFAGDAEDPEPDEIQDLVAGLHEIRDAAPEEVADEWAQLDDPYVELEGVLEENDVSWSEVAEAQSPEELPDEVAEAVQTFNDAFDELDESAITQTIVDHAQDECGLDLDGGEEQSGDSEN